MFQVTTLDLAKLPKKDGRVDYTQDFFDRPAFLTVSGQLEAEIFACALGKVYTFGPDVPRGELEHLAAPGRVLDGRAGDGLLRALTDNMDLAERFLKRIFRDVLAQMSRGHGVLQRADRQDRDRHASSRSSTAISSACPYTEAVEILKKSGETFEFPVRLGPRPARPSTSAT